MGGGRLPVIEPEVSSFFDRPYQALTCRAFCECASCRYPKDTPPDGLMGVWPAGLRPVVLTGYTRVRPLGTDAMR